MIKKITDSEQIVFRNEIFQRYLNVFLSRLVNRSRDYPSRDRCIASYTGGRSRPPSLFNDGFGFDAIQWPRNG